MSHIGKVYIVENSQYYMVSIIKYDFGQGIKETAESKCLRFMACTMPAVMAIAPNYKNITFVDYIFDFDRGIVINKDTGEEIIL